MNEIYRGGEMVEIRNKKNNNVERMNIYQEALEKLCKECSRSIIERGYLGCPYRDISGDYCEEYDYLQVAVKKTIKYDKKEAPLKPTKHSKEGIFAVPNCAKCKGFVFEEYNYCPRCGQRIDRSKE